MRLYSWHVSPTAMFVSDTASGHASHIFSGLLQLGCLNFSNSSFTTAMGNANSISDEGEASRTLAYTDTEAESLETYRYNTDYNNDNSTEWDRLVEPSEDDRDDDDLSRYNLDTFEVESENDESNGMDRLTLNDDDELTAMTDMAHQENDITSLVSRDQMDVIDAENEFSRVLSSHAEKSYYSSVRDSSSWSAVNDEPYRTRLPPKFRKRIDRSSERKHSKHHAKKSEQSVELKKGGHQGAKRHHREEKDWYGKNGNELALAYPETFESAIGNIWSNLVSHDTAREHTRVTSPRRQSDVYSPSSQGRSRNALPTPVVSNSTKKGAPTQRSRTTKKNRDSSKSPTSPIVRDGAQTYVNSRMIDARSRHKPRDEILPTLSHLRRYGKPLVVADESTVGEDATSSSQKEQVSSSRSTENGVIRNIAGNAVTRYDVHVGTRTIELHDLTTLPDVHIADDQSPLVDPPDEQLSYKPTPYYQNEASRQATDASSEHSTENLSAPHSHQHSGTAYAGSNAEGVHGVSSVPKNETLDDGSSIPRSGPTLNDDHEGSILTCPAEESIVLRTETQKGLQSPTSGGDLVVVDQGVKSIQLDAEGECVNFLKDACCALTNCKPKLIEGGERHAELSPDILPPSSPPYSKICGNILNEVRQPTAENPSSSPCDKDCGNVVEDAIQGTNEIPPTTTTMTKMEDIQSDINNNETCVAIVDGTIETNDSERQYVCAVQTDSGVMAESSNEAGDDVIQIEDAVLSETFRSFDLQQILSGDLDEADVGFAVQYHELFEEFMTTNDRLAVQNPDLLMFLKIAKLQKIFECQIDWEERLRSELAEIQREKEMMATNYHFELIEAAREKASRKVFLQDEVTMMKQAVNVLDARMQWKIIQKNYSRTHKEMDMLKKLDATKDTGDEPLQCLPQIIELQSLRDTLADRTISNDITPEEEESELLQCQIDSAFLNAEVTVLEAKLMEQRAQAQKYQWADKMLSALTKDDLKELQGKYTQKIGFPL